MSKFLFAAIAALSLSACSDVGFGLKNHPGDCAMGVAWADCLPGTAGYKGTEAQLTYQGVFKRQAEAAATNRQRIEAASAEAQACDGKFATRVQTAACVNDALRRGYADISYPYMDLVNTVAAVRMRAAEQRDSRQITEGEEAVQISEKFSAMISEERHRNAENTAGNAAMLNAKANAQAADAQANAVRQEGNLEMMRIGAQLMTQPRVAPMPMPTPTYTTCNRAGSQVNCITH